MSKAMSVREREAFLAAARVGVLVVARHETAPLAVPMWYSYQPGGLLGFITSRRSRKAKVLRTAGTATLCVHADDIPYRYLSVSGPVVEAEDPVTEDQRRELARRYLGPDGGDEFVARTKEATGDMVTFRLQPLTWMSQDQSR